MNNTLVKGVRILEILARSPDAVGVTEIATRASLLKSDAHRLVQSLVELGYVRQERDTGAYFATIRLWELGWSVMGRRDIRKTSEPWMGKLNAQTRETIHLSILDGHEAVYIHKLESPEPVRAFSEIGERVPAHAVATGKALLSRQEEAVQLEVASRLKRFTPRTIVEPAEFLRELTRIRSAGYAVNRGEWRMSVCGIAAAISDAHGNAVAAIGISGPAERVKPARFKELGKLVIEAANAISRSLAGTGSEAPARRRKLVA